MIKIGESRISNKAIKAFEILLSFLGDMIPISIS
jgi:hypothetical protein